MNGARITKALPLIVMIEITLLVSWAILLKCKANHTSTDHIFGQNPLVIYLISQLTLSSLVAIAFIWF